MFMKKHRLFIACLFLSLIVSAQGYDPSRVNKKVKALYDQAIERANDGAYPNAIALLQQCIALDKNYVDAYLSIAGVYAELKDHGQSVRYYEEAFAKDSSYTLDYKLPYSINVAALGQFEKALNAINDLLTKRPPRNPNSLKAAQYRQRCFAFAVDYAQKHPMGQYNFAPVNAGPAINTKESEYFPSLTIDQQELIFTRRLNGRNEDFFSSQKKEGEWTNAQPARGNVNTPDNEGAQNISQDGEWLVFTACNRTDGFGNCDLYISYRTAGGWSEAINLGGFINSDQWESQPCLSPDKKDLYFASRRPGGYGGIDIYVSHLRENGKWSEPENLGPEINTTGDEQCPFMHADNQTLYFTSNYWPGYGEDDIFLTRKKNGGGWTKALNLGYPINTIKHEGTLFVTADGKTAYYASDRSDSRGGLDIYSFELREDIRPVSTLWVKGKVSDKKTGKGLPSSIELTDLSTRETLSHVQTDEQGNYLVTLPLGRDYSFTVNRRGYLFYSDQFLLRELAPDSTYRKDIPLQPLEVNANIVLKNIFFDVNKTELRPESQLELDKVVQLLKENPGLKIQIEGHTDNAGKPADNLQLSNNRAAAVVTYIKGKGIAAARLVAKGFGETKPVSDNGTEEGRARNRRTELKITSL
ncbi:MAG: flagellar motor protein MotB [Sphingobacteriales bacterium SCN 48-20]|nr:MAG: flagellar motor protein MotB [Sphingobacteriales bacterium SCN 48-20]OJW44910.1 MAG: flagellar motor protein MotB [Sphingobacteriales bacterium 48-107]